jgi:hypothetical protein
VLDEQNRSTSTETKHLTAVLGDIFVDGARLSTVAGTGVAAVQEDLRRQGNLWPGLVAHDVETIAQSRGGAESPASTAIGSEKTRQE